MGFSAITGLGCVYKVGEDNLPKLLNGTITEVKNYPEITELKDYSLYNCGLLEEVNLPNVNKVGNYAMYNDVALKKLVLGDGTLSFGQNALYNCKSLYDFDFSNNNVTSLGEQSFYCVGSGRENPSTNRLTFNFKNSKVQQIPKGCFCSISTDKVQYSDFSFGKNIEYIDNNAFEYNDNCEYWFENFIPPVLSSTNAFATATNVKIFIPYYSANTYRTATNWSNFSSIMTAYMPANNMQVGETLPPVNREGYSLTWYSDQALTIPASTVEADTVYYCTLDSDTGAIYHSVVSENLEHCNYTLSQEIEGDIHYYGFGQAITTGAELTINISIDTGYSPWLIAVNGQSVNDGDTITVSSDLTIVAIGYDGVHEPVDTVLENNSWDVIRKVCRDGNALTYWNLGDTKQVLLSDGYTYNAQLIDATVGRYLLADGVGSSNVVFQFVELLSKNRAMNSTETNAGGWASCELRGWLNNTILATFPESLRNNISEVYVEEDGFTSNDKLFLISITEIGNGSYIPVDFDYWKQHPANRYNKHHINNPSETNANWWFRTMGNQSGFENSGFYGVVFGGPSMRGASRTDFGVCPCFAI